MMFICDALIVYRMVQLHSYHIIVSVMCPVFQLGVLAITCLCDTALNAMKSGVYNLPVDPALLRQAQTVIAIGVVASIAAMFVLFFVFSPLMQPVEGTMLFNLSSLHRMWMTNIFNKNLGFNFAYSAGMMGLGCLWVGIVGAYCNGVFIAWCRLRDCRHLAVELKTRANVLADAEHDSPFGSESKTHGGSNDDGTEDETFDALVSSLVSAVNDCLGAKTGMRLIIRLGFISVVFDVLLLSLFLVMSLLITKCSSVCKNYGTAAYEDALLSGETPCIYTRDNALLVSEVQRASAFLLALSCESHPANQVVLWFFGVLFHLLAWLFPLALLNVEIQTIRGSGQGLGN
jgi:hypothetical protein